MIPRVILCGFCFLGAAGVASGQVPAGDPFEAKKHPNPIVTFVESKDFNPTGYNTARDRADVDLLGLSRDEGHRESVEITPSDARKIKILGRKTEVLFFPVVKQNFRLTDGDLLVLYSFKDPRPDVPSEYRVSILNEHAFREHKKPKDGRFGLSSSPERLRIRRSEALLFDNDGELTLFWQGRGMSHVASGNMSREMLFWLVEDLL